MSRYDSDILGGRLDDRGRILEDWSNSGAVADDRVIYFAVYAINNEQYQSHSAGMTGVGDCCLWRGFWVAMRAYLSMQMVVAG